MAIGPTRWGYLVTTDARRGWHRGVGVLVAAVCAVGVSLLVAPAPEARAELTGDISITGHGYGHGRGMGQWGAYGYATRSGWSAQQILSHYYGGTTQSNQPNGPISVHLTGQDGRDLVVTSGRDFTVGGVLVSGGAAARVTARPDGSFVLSTSLGCAAPTVWTTSIPSGRVAPTVPPGDDLSGMLSLCTSTGTTHYRGELSAVWAANSQRTVNNVLMEDYLRGVVPRESPASWGDAAGGRGLEALKAQAVAARSYAWAEGRSSWARTCDTTSCQVYLGAGKGGSRLEDPRTDAAIAATSGVVLRNGGVIVRAEFSSSTGGWTAGGAFPAVVDDGDAASPHHDWTTVVPATTIAQAFGVGVLNDISVLSRNGLGADGGRVIAVQIVGSTKTVTKSGSEVRSALGLRSDWFVVAGVVDGSPDPGPGGSPPAVSGPAVVYRASTNGPGASATAVAMGQFRDVPLACDWDGDGIDTAAVFRSGTWYITDAVGSGVAQASFGFGQAGDQPVCGDWNGDGRDGPGIYRGGVVYLRNSASTGNADGSFRFGDSGDTLVAGNWDEDRYDTVGVWRRGVFYLTNSNIRPNTDGTVYFGSPGDLPVVGDWNGDGFDTPGVFRSGTFFLRDSNSSGAADVSFGFGSPGDRPQAGRWTGGHADAVGVARAY